MPASGATVRQSIRRKRAILLCWLGLWIGSGVLNYGLVLASRQRMAPPRALVDCAHDQQFAFVLALSGVAGTPGILLAPWYRYHGLLYRCLTPAEVPWRETEQLRL